MVNRKKEQGQQKDQQNDQFQQSAQTMQTRTHFGVPSLNIALILLCLIAITTCFTSGLYAKYIVTSSENDSARVAAFVFNLNDSASAQTFVDIGTIKKPGDTVTYSFKVTNSSGSVVCETGLVYTIRITANGNMPYSYTLKNAGNEEVLTGALTAGITLPLKKQYTGAAHFLAATAREDSYTLTITWPSSSNDAKYANLASAGSFEIEIYAQQVGD